MKVVLWLEGVVGARTARVIVAFLTALLLGLADLGLLDGALVKTLLGWLSSSPPPVPLL